MTKQLTLPKWDDLLVKAVSEREEQGELDLAKQIRDELGYQPEYQQRYRNDENGRIAQMIGDAGIMLLDNKSVLKYMHKMAQYHQRRESFWSQAIWEWRYTKLENYMLEVPKPILNQFLEIDKILKSDGLTPKDDYCHAIDTLQRVTPEMRIEADPFAFVLIKHPKGIANERLYFGVWDEPDFKGEYYMPGMDITAVEGVG